MHQPRRIKRSCGLEDYTDTSTVFVESLDVVGQLLVFTAMTFVSLRELQQNSVKLLDVVLAERNVGPGIKDHLCRFGVSRDFLFISGFKRTQIQVGQKQVDLDVR